MMLYGSFFRLALKSTIHGSDGAAWWKRRCGA